jgi:hypothetical protein
MPDSDTYGHRVGWIEVPALGDGLHHFGWNAGSSDIEPDPREPKLVKTIDEKTLSYKAGYSRPHTRHCGPNFDLRTLLDAHVVVGNRLRFFSISLWVVRHLQTNNAW